MEICASIVSSIAGNLSNRLFDAAGHHIGYLLNYDDNIEGLRKQGQKLEAIRGDLQVEIDAAKRDNKIILLVVQNWISEVDKVTAEAKVFLEDESNANKIGFRGWCINLRLRYRFSKVAKQKIAEITQLREDGKFQTLSQPAPPPSGIISLTVGFSGILKSGESIKNEIMEALKGDKIGLIGICGMGGVGKTTLMKQVGKQVEEEKLYDSIVMVIVSQTPNIMNIQAEIAEMLGLTSLSVNSKSARANSLWKRIKKEKRILIILDDVWSRIELEEIGIPSGKDHRGCKIVLTSRIRDVCDQMNCDRTFIVEILSKQESWALFKELVGMDVENSIISPIARDIVAECDGLPIAIVTLAGALKNKNEHVWIDVARQLRMSTPTDIPGMQGSVISSLELSIKYLESEDAKSLFLFCSVFPEDFEIPIEVLVRYGVALRWFKNVETMEDARHRVHAIVSTLTSCFLLIYKKHESFTVEEYVTLHDFVCNVAHIIAPKYNQIFLVKAGIGQNVWPNIDAYEDLTCISLMSNDIKEVSNVMKCPKLQSLLLQMNFNLVVPSNFFQGMEHLRVLDLSFTQLSPLPESFAFLENLRTLYLNGCKLGDLSKIANLNKLEILSLYGFNVREIPICFSRLTHLRLLDLNNCKELTRIAPGVISSLSKLEELYIVESFKLWDLEGNERDLEGDERDLRRKAMLAELQFLNRLTSLQINFPNLNLLIDDNDVPFKNLANLTIIIGAPEIYEKDSFMSFSRIYSRKLMISHNKVMILGLVDWLRNLFSEKTDYLYLVGSDNFFHDLVNGGLNELKGMTVKDQKVSYLVNTLECSSNLTFQNLEELQVINHPNLVEICLGELSIQSFNKLKSLTVGRCYRLSNIVPSHLLKRFQNLEYLKVSFCKSVVYIFDCEELQLENGETKFLSSLKDLNLSILPKMTHIWKGDIQYLNLCNLKRIWLFNCPNLIKLFSQALLQSLICLEEMSIHVCYNLEEIFITKEEVEKIPPRKDLTTTSPSLRNLTFILISSCSNLKMLFTPSIVKSLVKLRRLEIHGCSTLKEIITNEEASSSIQRIVFPNLSHLVLTDLYNIGCFSSGTHSIEFPVLETLKMYGCPKLKIFGYGELLTPKLNKIRLHSDDEEGRWMGNINSTVEQLFTEEQEKIRRGQLNEEVTAEKQEGLQTN